MKLAIISDVHGNLYALRKVLEDIDDQNVDLTVCLGDLVGYGPHPNEVVSMIKRRNIPCIKGNYDASVVDGDFTYIRETNINSFSLPWAVNEVRAANKYYLDNLPTSMTFDFNKKKIKLVHGSPNAVNEYLLEDDENTAKVMESLEEDVLICAHTHIPSVKSFGSKLFINDGSVGKPKIGTPESTYCILDIDNSGSVKPIIRHVSYELNGLIKEMKMLNFPDALIRSFEEGAE
ncbi:metallophosphatase family protein [Clostridium sp. SHJSY1]|uniref:metallophosphoesterase family protein n=1 Tax=Clostridium sp. SHJSY1 TaxID=2942483 RepID=UPI0028748EAD|nr:metallophosphoesterase family protein [Clostridium sp. SHJSY1]MDS0525317.1 metallophosphatase family protein [Clostridium sp. SHJSY1]